MNVLILDVLNVGCFFTVFFNPSAWNTRRRIRYIISDPWLTFLPRRNPSGIFLTIASSHFNNTLRMPPG